MQNTTNPKAFAYFRVSSKEQEQSGNGLSGQESAVREHAEKEGITIVGKYSDGGVSGKYISREGLDRMIADLNRANKEYSKIIYVIVDDIDRIVRDVAGWREIKGKIESAGASIYSLKQDLNDTPEGKMLQSITMSVKQYERENGGRRVRDRQRARLLDGYYIFPVPLGYKYVKAPGGRGKVIVGVPEYLYPIKEMLNMYSKGILLNKQQACNFLTDHGIISKHGNHINVNTITTLFKKENLLLYAGLISFDKREIDCVPARHEAIISVDTARHIVSKEHPKVFHIAYPESLVSHQLPLRKILKCSECGHTLTGTPSKGNGGIYFYYFCDQKECSLRKKSFNNQKVHAEVEGLLETLQINPEYMDAFEVIVNEFWNEKENVKQSLSLTKKSRLKNIDTNIQRIQDRIFKTENDMLIGQYEAQLIKLMEEQKQLTMELEKTSVEQEQDFVSHFNKLKLLIQNPLGIWNIEQLELRRMLINILFDGKISYNKKAGLQTNGIPAFYATFGLCMNTNFQMVGDIGLEPMTPCL